MRALMLALTAISDPDQEEEYNRWYDTVHANETMLIPGVVSCRRYKLAEIQAMEPSMPQFLSIYEVEREALQSLPEHFAQLAAEGRITTSEFVNWGTMALFEPLSRPAG